MLNWTLSFFEKIFVVFIAFLFVQAPLFMHQYELLLKGHINELTFQLKEIDLLAKENGKTRDQYIQKFLSQDDKDFKSQGLLLLEMNKRYQHLQQSLFQLQNTTALIRPFVFFSLIQYSIAKETFSSFHPGISFDLESMLYALFGIFIGSFVFSIFKKIALGFTYTCSSKKLKDI